MTRRDVLRLTYEAARDVRLSAEHRQAIAELRGRYLELKRLQREGGAR